MVAVGSPGTSPERAPLVGRMAERAVLEQALGRASGGAPGVVSVEGEAGVGKSALLRWLAGERSAAVHLLAASGEEGEQLLDLGVVEQLLDEAAALGVTAAAGFGRTGPRPEAFDVGAALVEVIAGLAATGPVLVVLDDAQWADPPSVQALTFAVRRVRRLPVLVVVGHRPEATHLEPLLRLADGERGTRMVLHGLGAAEVRELVAARHGPVLSPRAAERLRAHAAGLPLAVLALADELDQDELASGMGPLPAPRSYATVMLNRLAACSPQVERLVTAVAVAGAGVPAEAVASVPGLPAGAGLDAVVDEAVRHRLLDTELRAGRVVLDVAHPLLRSAIVQDVTPHRRADLHRWAAGVATDPARRVLHRLAASAGDDPALGREAVALGVERLRHGWELSAVELLTAAADRFPPGAERDGAVVAAAGGLAARGETSTARDLLARVTTGTGGPEAQLVLGHLAFLDGDARAATASLEGAWASAPDPSTAARAAMLLATVASNSAQAEPALTWARRALERGGAELPELGHALTMVASAWALAGDLAEGHREVERWRRRLRVVGSAQDTLLPSGVLLLWDGRIEEATTTLEQALRAPGDASPLLDATVRYSLADARYRAGAWDGALADAEQLAVTLDDAGAHLAAPMAHSVAAFVLAGRGRPAEAEDHLARAAHAATSGRNPAALLWQLVAEARARDAVGDPAGVVDRLGPLAELTADLALPEGVQPWRADLVEALAVTGQLDRADREARTLEARLVGGGAHARTGAARALGVLAAVREEDGAAAAHFAAGLDEDEGEAGAFTRARLELAAGAFERRRGGRRAADRLLRLAEERCAALGAEPYASRAARELEACGLAPRGRGAVGGDPVLTPAELAVARLVATGATNREVAATLVVSAKTVESHLSRVFAKLGVRSRTELAGRWAALDPGPPPP